MRYLSKVGRLHLIVAAVAGSGAGFLLTSQPLGASESQPECEFNSCNIERGVCEVIAHEYDCNLLVPSGCKSTACEN